MKKKLLMVLLLLIVIFAYGCSCDSWNRFWGKDPAVECASHWKWKEEEPVAKLEEKKYNPCAAPSMTKTTQSYPIRDTGGMALRVEKMAPSEIRSNEAFNYQIKVTNMTGQLLQNVIVKDRVPANLKIKSSTPKFHKEKAGEFHWSLGSLDAKVSKLITINAVAEGKGSITSCAEVTYDSPICAKIDIVEPILALTKIAPDESLMCDRIPIKYEVSNTGSGFACDIKISDSFGEGLMTAEQKNDIEFSLESLGPGQSKDFEIMLDASKIGTYSSKALAISRAGGKVESNLSTIIVNQPVLSVTQSGPSSQYANRSITYEFTITNRGDGIAKNTIIETVVPEEVKFQSATMGGLFTRLSPGKVIWKLGDLKANDSKKVSMTVRMDKTGALTTETKARAYCAETISESFETSVSGISAILLELVDISDPIEVGQNETYTITVTNQGTSEATNVQISCILESNTEYVSSSGPTTAILDGNKLIFEPLSSLAARAQTKWQVNVKALSAGDTRFKVMMNSDQLDRLVDESEATMFYE